MTIKIVTLNRSWTEVLRLLLANTNDNNNKNHTNDHCNSSNYGLEQSIKHSGFYFYLFTIKMKLENTSVHIYSTTLQGVFELN